MAYGAHNVAIACPVWDGAQTKAAGDRKGKEAVRASCPTDRGAQAPGGCRHTDEVPAGSGVTDHVAVIGGGGRPTEKKKRLCPPATGSSSTCPPSPALHLRPYSVS